MAFDWYDYLELAKTLKALGNSNFALSEAAHRSAVSRSYYAAFRYSRDYLEMKNIYRPRRQSEDHRNVISYLNDHDYGEASSSLNDLLEWRHACDYDDPVENFEMMINNAINNAQIVFDEVQ